MVLRHAELNSAKPPCFRGLSAPPVARFPRAFLQDYGHTHYSLIAQSHCERAPDCISFPQTLLINASPPCRATAKLGQDN